MATATSNSNPPFYPLLNTEAPLSFKLKDEDLYVLDETGSGSLLSLSSNNSKKRAAEDHQQTCKLQGDAKRRLTLKSNDAAQNPEAAQDTEVISDEGDHDAAIDAEPTNPSTVDSSAIVAHKEYENSDLPLPSPSASPILSSYDDNLFPTPETPSDSLELINLIENLTTNSLTLNARNFLIFKLLSKTDRTTLSDLSNTINLSLKRDIISNLPTEISTNILKQLDYKSLNSALLVSKSWTKLITQEFWKNLLYKEHFITKDELEQVQSSALLSTSYYHETYIERYKLYQNWIDPDFEPKRITVPCHGALLIACLQLDGDRVVTGADDKMINIYSADTGQIIKVLQGHEGGVWALKSIGDQIVSGSTDRTVRVWNTKTGKCTHIFRGHTSTIRSMEIVTLEDTEEKLIVTGSRDNTLHVWRLPKETDKEYLDDSDGHNPYFVTVLRGHTASVRTVAGFGNLVISGSYDHTIRVWDLKKKTTKFVLTGHTDRIYAIVLDKERNRCISASMDSKVRVWDLNDGRCIAHLVSHTSLVGLVGLSDKYLVSAAADGTLRGWDPDTYKSLFTLHHDNHTPITTFFSTSNLLVSGGEGQFNAYDLKHGGRLVRSNLLPDCGQVWSAKFDHKRCVIAVEKNGKSFLEILDFTKRQLKPN